MVSVVYVGNGNTGGNGNYWVYDAGFDPVWSNFDVLVNPGNITKTGATLKGWAFTSNATTPTFVIDGDSVSPSWFGGNANYEYYDSNMDCFTLYAVWENNPTFKVTYDAGNFSGTTGSPPTDNNNYAPGAIVTVLGQGTLARPNYIFDCWWDDTAMKEYKPGATFIMPSRNVLLEVTWIAARTVTYNANGGSNPPTDPNSPYANNSTVTVLGQGSMSRSGYTFQRWNTNSSGTGTNRNPGDTFIITANTTLYAVWQQNVTQYTLSYNGNTNTGGSAPASVQVNAGASTTVAGQGTLVKTNYNFKDWNTQANGSGTTYTVGASITLNSNVTLYAQWAQTYTITYNGNTNTGGTAPTNSNRYEQGQTFTAATKGTLTKTGYTFQRWNTNSVGTGTNYNENATVTMGSSNMTLYAVWLQDSVETYTVTYTAGGASGTPPVDPNSPYQSGSTVTVLPPTGLSKTGYKFTEWKKIETLVTHSLTNNTSEKGTDVLNYATGISFICKKTCDITKAVFRLRRASTGSTTAKVVAQLYSASSNTVSSASINILLAQSDPITVNNLPSSFGTVEFTFSGTQIYTITLNTVYFIVVRLIDITGLTASNNIRIGLASGYSSGRCYTFDGQSTFYTSTPPCCELYGLTNVPPGYTFTITNNTILEATWIPASQVTVTYDGNGNTGGSVPPSQTDYETISITVANHGDLAKTNHIFVKWNTSSDGSSTDYFEGVSLTLVSNVTLYAIWEENPKGTITYHANTGSGIPPPPQTDYVGNTITVSNQGSLYKTNYTFVKWNTQADGSGDDYFPNGSLIITGNVTLYAIWGENQKYSLSYDGNGHTGGSVPSPQTDYVNTVVTVASRGSLVNTNHNFKHWNTNSSNTGTIYLENASHTLLDDIILYAIWAPTFSVTYNGNGHTDGSVPTNSNRYEAGQTFAAATKGTLVKANHTFVCWNTQADGLGTNYNENATVTVGHNDIILYAVWQEHPKYTVSYDGNGHTSGTAPTSQTDYVGTQIYVKGHGDLEKSGYHFTHWNTEADDSGTRYDQGNIITLSADLTLYAQWTNVPTYTVTYAPGLYGVFEAQVTSDLQIGDPTPAPPLTTGQPGYSFSHWSPTPSSTVTGDATYTAQWTQDTYTVTYSPGTQGTFQQQVTSNLVYGDPTPTAPTVTGNLGYTFTGWNPTLTLMVTGTVEYVAQWSQDKYTVIYHPGSQGTWTAASQTTTNLTYGVSTPLFTGNTATDHNPGYTFSHWQPSIALTVTGNVTYTAQWTQDKYTVTYAPGSQGTFSPQTTSNLVYGDPTPSAPTPTCNPGYVFGSWSPVPSLTVTGNATYTAQWIQLKYTVTYDPGDHGDFTAQTTENLVYGDPTPKAPDPVAEAGWLFDGWFPVPSLTVTVNAVYVAQWVQELYTVTFSPGLHGAFPTQITSGLVYGDPTPEPPTPTPVFGYTFAYWSPVIASTVTESVVYTAIWNIILYYVTYDGNGANTGIPPIDTMPYSVENQYAIVKGSGSLNKQKSDFDGWSLDPNDLKGAYRQGDAMHVTGNTTLYAIWVKRNMITQPNDCRWFWDEVRNAKQSAGIPLNKNPYDP